MNLQNLQLTVLHLNAELQKIRLQLKKSEKDNQELTIKCLEKDGHLQAIKRKWVKNKSGILRLKLQEKRILFVKITIFAKFPYDRWSERRQGKTGYYRRPVGTGVARLVEPKSSSGV